MIFHFDSVVLVIHLLLIYLQDLLTPSQGTIPSQGISTIL